MSLLLALLAAAAVPQAIDHAAMPGMAMPADPDCPPEHAAMGHCKPSTRPTAPAPELPPPPAVPADSADRIWGADAMAASRAMLHREHGGGRLSQVMFNLAEIRVQDGRDGYHWDGEVWFGGDIDRLAVKTQGQGDFGTPVEAAEVQALYSRAIGPYFNLQAGVRHDPAPRPARTYAVVGIEGLAPYWFDVEGALFLSDRGDLLARIEGYYDQRMTQRLVLQPRVEINAAAQDVPASRIGAGITDAELGVRLRYEIAREFAPYVGLVWERKFAGTARLARAAGEGAGGASLAVGIRAWF